MSNNGEINHDLEEPNNSILWIGVLITTTFITACILFSIFYFKELTTIELNNKDNTPKSYELSKMEIEAKESLSKFKYLNEEKTLVQVPLNIAKKLVLKEYER